MDVAAQRGRGRTHATSLHRRAKRSDLSASCYEEAERSDLSRWLMEASCSEKYAPHIGSSSFITDATGYAVQHLQYQPFGEAFVDQTSATNPYDSRYTFSAKEKPACRNASSGRDDETQYSYFGARYYDSDLSVWLSVDPYSKKYPHLSPYCAFENNPIVIKDPGGDTTIYYSSDGKLLHFSNDKLPTSIVLIKSEYASTFSGHVAYAASLGIEHHDEANKGWRTRGLNIDVNSLRKFFKDNTVKGENDICDNCPGGHRGYGYMNEYRANLYEKDNKVVIGNNVVTDNLTAYIETLPDIENLGRLIGTIHDHANEDKPTFEHGPSLDCDRVNMRELDIIVGREQIYIYGTRPQTIITINIKTLLKGHVDYPQ